LHKGKPFRAVLRGWGGGNAASSPDPPGVIVGATRPDSRTPIFPRAAFAPAASPSFAWVVKAAPTDREAAELALLWLASERLV
jgi:hypothetical protein